MPKYSQQSGWCMLRSVQARGVAAQEEHNAAVKFGKGTNVSNIYLITVYNRFISYVQA